MLVLSSLENRGGTFSLHIICIIEAVLLFLRSIENRGETLFFISYNGGGIFSLKININRGGTFSLQII